MCLRVYDYGEYSISLNNRSMERTYHIKRDKGYDGVC